MVEIDERIEKPTPPEGGWGYLVMLSVFIAHLTAVVPLCAFGIIYGKFMESLGNATFASTLSLSGFLTCISLTGLVSNFLLRMFSFRQVGLLGACILCASYIISIFVKNLPLFLFSFALLGGLGGGILLPPTFSSLNEYFYKKMNFVMGLAQLFITTITILYPLAAVYSMENFGFFNTKVILACISGLNFFGVWALQPVEWHINRLEGRELSNKREYSLQSSEKPLLVEEDKRKTAVEESMKSVDDSDKNAAAFTLLKSPKFLNIIIGLSLSFNSDNLFIGVIGLILNNLGFNNFDVATMSMVHYACDLVSRIIFVVVSVFYPLKNRYVFLAGSLFTAIFRIAYVFYDGYIWRTTILAILGFFRCFIQTSAILVIAEEYRDTFPTAFTLFMVASGIASLILGLVANYVKDLTNSDAMFLQVLTVALAITVISWSIELIYKAIKKN